ncbi:MAG: class I SAM-dependent methyltransferase [Acetatifactor sp.]|nr:class I SAM-dependent methyltransferase [Acetatifactor sp.]
MNAIYDIDNNNMIITNVLTGVSYSCPAAFGDRYKAGEFSHDERLFFLHEGFYAKDIYELQNFYPIVTPYAIWNENCLVYFGKNDDIIKTEVSADLSFILSLCNGNISICEILDCCEIPKEKVYEFMNFCISSENQIIKLLSDKLGNRNIDNFFGGYTFSLASHNPVSKTDNDSYYRNLSEDNVERQFTDIETTISYMLRNRTSILHNKSYGECLFKILYNKMESEVNQNIGLSILEIGAGLGDVALSILDTAPSHRICDYTICDISASMLAAQRNKIGTVHNGIPVQYIHNNILNSPTTMLKRYDLIICNEVIADLPSITLKQCSNEVIRSKATSMNYLEGDYINIGAFELITRLWELLSSGGIAFVSEYSESDNIPQISRVMGDHQETSIDFRLLEDFANEIGFHSLSSSLMSFMEIEHDISVVSPHAFFLLQSVYGLNKGFIATQDLESINFLGYQNIKMVALSMFLRHFKTLLLQKT